MKNFKKMYFFLFIINIIRNLALEFELIYTYGTQQSELLYYPCRR
jgi:hypothetical protein